MLGGTLIAYPVVSLGQNPIKDSLCREGALFITTGLCCIYCSNSCLAAWLRPFTSFIASTGVYPPITSLLVTNGEYTFQAIL